ncbi:ABC transporter related [Candidatus Sulfopaludibacter sp. SbA4]|nr:ABC transporter related [Candidatus Sulfopaludibacter sp. SbA4]
MIAAPAIQTSSLSKYYGRTSAVQNLDLVVEANRITGFLGRNGAGKSTTIKMLLGLIRPTGGDGTILGRQITNPELNRQARAHIAYVAEDKPLYRYLTVAQTVRFAAAFYRDWRCDVAGKLLREYELPLNRRVKALSKGMRTKLALLLALARKPELLILDEPTEGLDPVMIEHLMQTIVARAAEGTAVFFSSHQIAEVERVADQVCILDRGCLVLDRSLDSLRESFRRVDMVFPVDVVEREFQLPGVERIRANRRQMSVLTSANAEGVIERARAFNAVSLEVAPVGLRDVFLAMVNGLESAIGKEN